MDERLTAEYIATFGEAPSKEIIASVARGAGVAFSDSLWLRAYELQGHGPVQDWTVLWGHTEDGADKQAKLSFTFKDGKVSRFYVSADQHGWRMSNCSL